MSLKLLSRDSNWIQHITTKKWLISLFVVLAIFATAQSMLLGLKQYKESDWQYPSYNNYTIFKQSFYHLIHHQDLYQHYPAEHWDLYKYTPTFSLFFGVFAIWPDAIGLLLWSLLNALVLVFAIYLIPGLTEKKKGLILFACAIEAMTAMQNEQSNGLIAGLIIMAFALSERNRFVIAIGCIMLASFIKPFGLVGFAMFLFYPHKWRHSLFAICWAVFLFFIPLLVLSFQELLQQYQSWKQVLAADQAMKYGYSVAGWLHTWFGLHPNKNALTLIGAMLFLIPFGMFRRYRDYDFRLLALSSILIWVVIFNHMAESPTFIIAMAGAAIWFFSKERNTAELILFLFVFAFVSLSPTDIVPHELRKSLFRPYVLKVVPCIILWSWIWVEMIRPPVKPQIEVKPQPICGFGR